MDIFKLHFENFEKLFPFCFTTDEIGKIVHAAPSLKKISRHVVDRNFFDVFKFVRPALINFQAVQKTPPSEMIVIHLHESNCQLMGQILYNSEEKKYLFVVSLLTQSLADLQRLSLNFSDFAVQDQVFDFLMLLQSQRRSIAEADKLNKKLIEANQQTLKALEMKNEFLANMSHELITPMNGVLGMASVLTQTDLTEAQREYIQCIVDSGNHMLSMVKDILEISKMETETLSLDSESFNLSEFLSNIKDEIHFKAHAKKTDIHVLLNMQNSNTILADKIKLKKILLNILDNAIKFTEKGMIQITVDSQSFPGYLHFSVKDSGTGIANEKLDKIFDSFVQVDSSMSKRYGGIGLGLAICKKLVQAMGGEIGVKSKIGQGSEFWFTIKSTPPRSAAVLRPTPH